MEFEIKSRQGVFVYLYHLKQSKQLRRFGTISYVSRRMKYVVLYMDSADVSENVKKIEKLRFVKGVELSERSTKAISILDSNRLRKIAKKITKQVESYESCSR